MIKKKVVGSQALRYWQETNASEYDLDINLSSEDSDTDYWVSDNALAEEDSHLVPQALLDKLDHEWGYVSPQHVLTIKLSHFQWDIKWEKTLRHILHLYDAGIEPDWVLFEDLLAFHKEEHGNKPYLSLDRDKEEFFNDNVTYVVDHDHLHDLVSFPNDPVYKKVRKGEVMICRELFDMLPHEEQIQMFREEISTIAVERWMINPAHKGKHSFFAAYMMSFKKTLCDLTKNWASTFILKNIRELLQPDYNLVKHVLETFDLPYPLEHERLAINDQIIWLMAKGDWKGAGYEHVSTHKEKNCYWNTHIFKLDDQHYKAESYRGCQGIRHTLIAVKPKLVTVTVYE